MLGSALSPVCTAPSKSHGNSHIACCQTYLVPQTAILQLWILNVLQLLHVHHKGGYISHRKQFVYLFKNHAKSCRHSRINWRKVMLYLNLHWCKLGLTLKSCGKNKPHMGCYEIKPQHGLQVFDFFNIISCILCLTLDRRPILAAAQILIYTNIKLTYLVTFHSRSLSGCAEPLLMQLNGKIMFGIFIRIQLI